MYNLVKAVVRLGIPIWSKTWEADHIVDVGIGIHTKTAEYRAFARCIIVVFPGSYHDQEIPFSDDVKSLINPNNIIKIDFIIVPGRFQAILVVRTGGSRG
jgi:hypothetical protein